MEAMIDAIRGTYGFLTFRSLETRTVAIERIFQPHAVWYESNGITTHGRENILVRSGHIIAQLPGMTYRLKGQPSICQNLITQAWEAVPEGTEGDENQMPSMTGRDVLLVEDQLVKTLWTSVDQWDEDKIPVLPWEVE
jgi:hypothetical protein